MGLLHDLQRTPDPLEQNRQLFGWLSEPTERAAFYADLRNEGCPIVRVPSLLGYGERGAWPRHDLYLVSARRDVVDSLQRGRVDPYAGLPSGREFMLAMDDVAQHRRQRDVAANALRYTADEIERCIEEAWELATVLPLKHREIDAVEIAEQTALRFVELLFGLPRESHVFLERVMAGVYQLLTYQIVGRHFLGTSGVDLDDPRAKRAADGLDADLEEVLQADRTLEPSRLPDPPPIPTVLERLAASWGAGQRDELLTVAKGLIAGTIGNVRAAVAIAIAHLMAPVRPPRRRRLIDDPKARTDAAWLAQQVDDALLADPPAPFLPRSAPRGLHWCDVDGARHPVPEGAELLLLMGVDPDADLVFGGVAGGAQSMHQCVGRHLAAPLVNGIVRRIAALPGLEERLDADGLRRPPERRWGSIYTAYPLQYQREQRLNQQPLFVVLPIKPPVAENARRLEALTRGGAPIVEHALDGSRQVHFAWFNIIEGGTHLAMTTAYDGDFDAYVRHFAITVDLFDRQFELLDVEQPRPIREHPREFVETIRKYNRAPLAGYFYSAYPRLTVAEIDSAGIAGSSRKRRRARGHP